MKKISPTVKLKIVELSSCFWYWSTYYSFYAAVLGVPKSDLGIALPRDRYTKYAATEFILEKMIKNEDQVMALIRAFYELNSPFDQDKNVKYSHAVKELAEFKETVKKYIDQENSQNIDFKKQLERLREESGIAIEKGKRIDSLKEDFLNRYKSTSQADKQARGYWLEGCIYELLKLDGIENTPPYKTEDEQIDGHFKFGSFDYLIEAKWIQGKIKKEHISIFSAKVKNKAQSNRGAFFAINGFDESAYRAAQDGGRNMIFIDGTDIM